jgi:hypothetical protein
MSVKVATGQLPFPGEATATARRPRENPLRGEGRRGQPAGGGAMGVLLFQEPPVRQGLLPGPEGRTDDDISLH